MALRRILLADGREAAVGAAAAALAAGEVVIFPTETVYGVGVVCGNAEAATRLRLLKGRGADKPFQVLVSGVAMAESMGGVFPAGARRLGERHWPGPLTLVVPTRTPGETVGLRVPADDFVRAVIDRIGLGIVTASANPAGAPAPVGADEADVFGDGAALLVDGGPCRIGAASTVVAVRDDGFDILREGALGGREIKEAWAGCRSSGPAAGSRT